MRVIIRDSCRNMNICSNRKNTPKIWWFQRKTLYLHHHFNKKKIGYGTDISYNR